MDLETFKTILAGEREDDLSPTEAEAFEQLLTTPEGRELLAEAEDALAPLTNWEPPEVSPEEWERVHRAVMARQPSTAIPFKRRSTFPLFLALAAGLFFVVGVAFLIAKQPGNGNGDGIISSTAPKLEAVTLINLSAGEGFDAKVEQEEGLFRVVVRERK